MRKAKNDPDQVKAFRADHTLAETSEKFDLSIRQINRICKVPGVVNVQLDMNKLKKSLCGNKRKFYVFLERLIDTMEVEE